MTTFFRLSSLGLMFFKKSPHQKNVCRTNSRNLCGIGTMYYYMFFMTIYILNGIRLLINDNNIMEPAVEMMSENSTNFTF